ncbi:MAG: HD domain-containing protein [Blautia sp.]|nr:HD domain-containing protein [Blautia sp.]
MINAKISRETFYNDYVERMKEIRRLSAPSLEGIVSADEYSDRLRQSFIRIGKLAAENRAFLDEVLEPILGSGRPLTQNETRVLNSFNASLFSASEVENIDLPTVSKVSMCLLSDSKRKEDPASYMQNLDTRMDVCYALMTLLGRIDSHPEISNSYRDEGLSIGRLFLSKLTPEEFAGLETEELRQLALTDARYMVVFFEGFSPDDPMRLQELEILDRMLSIVDDAYYRELAPNFNWSYFQYRLLNYYAKTTDLCNICCFDDEILSTICDRTEYYMKLWQSDPAYFSQFDNETQVRMLLERNRYLAGRTDASHYLDSLVSLYQSRDPHRYDLSGICDNLQIPLEYFCMLDPETLTGEQKKQVSLFYKDILLYAFRMPNNGSLSSLLEYYICIIDRFIEIPGGITFEEMVLQCMAALHPPTYIHSVMVARLARSLCMDLINRRPELLIGICGCTTPEEVMIKAEEICLFVYHAGLCHDFGKLAIIDTIFVYGRSLTDMEFEVIRTHPEVGFRMLSRYDSTRPYADAALGHHRWYNNERGYPRNFDVSRSPIKVVIDLVQCADCLDAATDSVGRSYRSGKTFDDIVREISRGAGTRYAPWLFELLADEETTEDLRSLLLEGRRQTYRGTYHLLVKMHDQREARSH